MKQKRYFKTLLIPDSKLRDAMELYPGKTRNEVNSLLYREIVKRLLCGGASAVLLLGLALFFPKSEKEEGILRPSPGASPLSVVISLNAEGEQGEIPLSVGALEYEDSEIEKLHAMAIEWLIKTVPGENESLDKVTQNLEFPTVLPLTGEKIIWSTEVPRLVTTNGEVRNKELTTMTPVEITAKIYYGSEYRVFSHVVTVYPAVYSEEEALLLAVQSELTALEERTRKQERFQLPDEILGYPVSLKKTDTFSPSAFLFLLSLIVPLMLYFNYFETLDKRCRERKRQAEECYTEFVTKLTLLLAAGVSLRQAFIRLAAEYEKNYGAEHVLAKELKVTRQELENGGSESRVYEEFGRRIGSLAYRRMASLVTQSVFKGVQGMKHLLLQEANEVMAQERANIRQRGEQAGTKLLFPMMGLLLLVFAILLVPAFQSF